MLKKIIKNCENPISTTNLDNDNININNDNDNKIPVEKNNESQKNLC